jgi:hypothetical protein
LPKNIGFVLENGPGKNSVFPEFPRFAFFAVHRTPTVLVYELDTGRFAERQPLHGTPRAAAERFLAAEALSEYLEVNECRWRRKEGYGFA